MWLTVNKNSGHKTKQFLLHLKWILMKSSKNTSTRQHVFVYTNILKQKYRFWYSLHDVFFQAVQQHLCFNMWKAVESFQIAAQCVLKKHPIDRAPVSYLQSPVHVYRLGNQLHAWLSVALFLRVVQFCIFNQTGYWIVRCLLFSLPISAHLSFNLPLQTLSLAFAYLSVTVAARFAKGGANHLHIRVGLKVRPAEGKNVLQVIT